MKRIGTLNGKAVVTGDSNAVTKNQILYNKEKNGSISLSERDNSGGLKPITGGGGLNEDSDYFIYIDGNKLTLLESSNIIEIFAVQFIVPIKPQGFPVPTFWGKMDMDDFDTIIPLEYGFEGSGFSEDTKKVYALPKKVPFPASSILGSGFVYPEEVFGTVDIKEWMLQMIEYTGMPEEMFQQFKFYIEEAFTIGQITKEEFLNS